MAPSLLSFGGSSPFLRISAGATGGRGKAPVACRTRAKRAGEREIK
jgi:hypothetical protein